MLTNKCFILIYISILLASCTNFFHDEVSTSTINNLKKSTDYSYRCNNKKKENQTLNFLTVQLKKENIAFITTEEFILISSKELIQEYNSNRIFHKNARNISYYFHEIIKFYQDNLELSFHHQTGTFPFYKHFPMTLTFSYYDIEKYTSKYPILNINPYQYSMLRQKEIGKKEIIELLIHRMNQTRGGKITYIEQEIKKVNFDYYLAYFDKCKDTDVAEYNAKPIDNEIIEGFYLGHKNGGNYSESEFNAYLQENYGQKKVISGSLDKQGYDLYHAEGSIKYVRIPDGDYPRSERMRVSKLRLGYHFASNTVIRTTKDLALGISQFNFKYNNTDLKDNKYFLISNNNSVTTKIRFFIKNLIPSNISNFTLSKERRKKIKIKLKERTEFWETPHFTGLGI